VSEQETRQENFSSSKPKNSLNMLSAEGAEKCLRALVSAGPRKRCVFGLRIFAAAKDRAGVNQEAGDFPSEVLYFFYAAAEKLSSMRATAKIYFSSSPRRNS
jgi:hypothetical protein